MGTLYRAAIPVDGDYTTQILSGLVRINSVNPALVPGAPGESEVAEFTATAMRELGLTVSVYEPELGRVSVVGVKRGAGKGRSLMLNAHYDTVGVEGMNDPFSAAIRGTRLYGRGAYDMKGSLAACLGAVKALEDAQIQLPGDLVVAAVADEEHASIGTADLIPRLPVDAAIVTEPTQLNICLAHKGFVWLEIETLGRAAHGSRPEEGVDANMRMGRVLAALQALEAELSNRPPHSLVGRPSLHAATRHGGTGLSTYAARCVLAIERRTIPGETEEGVTREVRRMLDSLRGQDPTLESTLRTLMVRDPFEIGRDALVVRAVSDAVEDVLETASHYVGETPWMDSALLANAGIETVVIGPHGSGAHADEEWVDLNSVKQLAAVLARTAIKVCG